MILLIILQTIQIFEYLDGEDIPRQCVKRSFSFILIKFVVYFCIVFAFRRMLLNILFVYARKHATYYRGNYILSLESLFEYRDITEGRANYTEIINKQLQKKNILIIFISSEENFGNLLKQYNMGWPKLKTRVAGAMVDPPIIDFTIIRKDDSIYRV